MSRLSTFKLVYKLVRLDTQCRAHFDTHCGFLLWRRRGRLEFADGFHAALLHCSGAGSCVSSWAYSGKVKGEDTPLAFNYSGNDAPNYPP